MGNPTLIRASVNEGVTEVKVLMQHAMETGLRKGDDDELMPAWYITHVKVQHDDKTVLEGQFGTAVSKNPYLVLRFQRRCAGRKSRGELGRYQG